MKTKHILLALFSLALVGGSIWYFSNKSEEETEEIFDEEKENSESDISTQNTQNTQNKNKDNMNLLLSRLGANIKPNKDNVVQVAFNNGKNLAQFYLNNRIIVFDSNKKVINKGTYSEGGTKIKMDSGKYISSGSVWQNLLETLKK